MPCSRTGRADSEAQHKRDCLKCLCPVCTNYLVERYSVVEKDTEQTTLPVK